MADELLHGAGQARAHVQESWAPVVIDDRTLSDWGKLATEAVHHEGRDPDQGSDSK